ncbi:MAG: triose-phosphate isomerase [gamma proteobacterium symbiont of Bathyaustriella thionipta]|nr:triose-phosphate isomerase [gamma proteobacterium symbiont of Bathyaustriella thionipta]MCU7948852.1 triose-phosphate isomerase [gamma proteobacterium symbiont of Bathyaustriella thionipta]MCU7951939.1 triose-phosphate isomerase [gamma proteobacterium symbiont of Bathyaustriella thionipta]MCU7955426.1 triose-phosphate isomerase [gamma proteobacterium symbiont of Bathyaustriella thionipta]MCU7965757.1 triose-phosphate isomerase [gamma proteobacterium symbiont of Bathyaustriella thionipta]
MRTPLVAGNWKMNGSRASVKELINGVVEGAKSLNGVEVAVCPSMIHIADVTAIAGGSNVAVGSQDACTELKGAFTGETSIDMIKDFGCQYAIIGHSERRTIYGETDEIVAEKYSVVKKAGVTPIFCIGETLEERETNITEEVCARQIDAVFAAEGDNAFEGSVIAYEPVWAIGTGKTASPEQAQAVHAFIRQHIARRNADIAEKVQILYGGSMNPANAKELIGQTDIDGGLIGGASLKAEDFLAVCQAGQ